MIWKVWTILMACLGLAWGSSARADLPTQSSSAFPAEPAQKSFTAVDSLRQMLLDVSNRIDSGDKKGAQALLLEITQNSAFDLLPDRQRYAVHLAYGALLSDAEAYGEAAVQLKAATAFDIASSEAWRLRLDAAARLDDQPDEILAVTTVAKRWPEDLKQIDDDFLFRLHGRARQHDALLTTRIVMLQALSDAAWAPSNPFLDGDGLWLDLANDLATKGQIKAAQAIAHKIKSAGIIAELLYTKRYDAITAADPAFFNVAAASARQADLLSSKARDLPDKLDGVNALALVLYKQGQFAQSLALLDAAIALARPIDGAKSPFTDMDQLIWTDDARAMALLALGRTEEALAAYRAGAVQQERGQTNVSQSLNLAEILVNLGRPAEGLAIVPMVGGDLSPFGRMDREAITAEAYFQLHDVKKLQASLDYLKSHVDDAPTIVIQVLSDCGDEEGAAREAIRQLKDPYRQTAVLRLLQGNPEPPSASPLILRSGRLKAALGKRADVQAAVDRVGRILFIPLY